VITVFVTGGTGYIGRTVIPELLRRGHRVRALVRAGSERKLPPGCEAVTGDALDATSFTNAIAPADTFVQLVGTPHPNPKLAAEFERVDLVSVRESAKAAASSGIRHFVYVSVAQPAPIMQAYVSVRARGEAFVRESRIPATFLRPWYVLGPGHRWPYLILPLYGVLWLIPSKRDTAVRLFPIRLRTMARAIVAAVETPPRETRVWDVGTMRGLKRAN
jgi:uncharacterized protein YbjT (DUF2867 family)